MRLAYRLVVYLFSCLLALMIVGQHAEAKNKKPKLSSSAVSAKDLSYNFPTSPRPHAQSRAALRVPEVEAMLYDAIMERLGAPYRARGTDERGYDCSGFVWRVFQEAGVNFGRSSARTLWETLPPASADEATQFGTLVFFKGLGHVGIVRDAYSFYHASSSQGVIRSFYSGYWGDRVIGYRRVPLLEGGEVTGR